MNTLDRSITDNLRISRNVRATSWLHYQQCCDAVLMSELTRKPMDARARAYPHQVADPIPATMLVPTCLHALIVEVVQLNAAATGYDHGVETILRLALENGLRADSRMLRGVVERLS